jgi:uncharacterized protein (UPF0276 family)
MDERRALRGHGVGLRHPHYDDFFRATPEVDFVEAVTENYLAPGGRPLAALMHVRRELPVALHGVSLSVGSVEPLDERYLVALKDLVKRVEPVWVTDHLSWGRRGGHYAHDLWPMPFTEEAVRHVASRVRQVQDFLGRRIALENVSSYAEYRASTLTEWDFLNAVVREADCRILLDVNNIFVSTANQGFSPERYLDAVDASRVVQLHLAGYSDEGTHLVDTHDAPVFDGVWALYERAVERFGPVATLIEWDDRLPPLERLVDESRKARRVEAQVLARGKRVAG